MTAMPLPLPQPVQPDQPDQPDQPALAALESVYDPEVIFVETPEAFDAMLQDFARRWDAPPAQRYLRLDTEADGRDARTATPLLLQVAASEEVAYVLPLNRQEEHRPKLGRFWDLVRAWQPLVIGHNLAYDYKLLRAHGLLPALAFTRLYDTQLAELVLTTGHFDQKMLWLKSVSLKSLVTRYLGLAMDKEVRASFIGIAERGGDHARWSPTNEQLWYGALDLMPLVDIERKQFQLLARERLIPSLKLRFNALQPVVEMELRGMLIDQQAWRAYLADVAVERDAAERELVKTLSPYEWNFREQKFFADLTALKAWETERDLLLHEVQKAWEGSDKTIGWGQYKNERMKAWREVHPRPAAPKEDYSPINLGSPKQKLRALNALGLELDSTNRLSRAKALRGELEEEQRSVLTLYERFSGLNRIIEGFGENVLAMIDPQTGRLHTHFNIHVTETGRWSSEKPNFQNMPRAESIRHAFVADPGMVVITADYSGQELAIVAALSDCGAMKRDIALGRDLYKEVASQVWKLPVEQVSKEQRQKAKSALLGINYGLSANGLERQHGMPKAEGEALLRTIKHKYPEVVAWGDKMAAQAFTDKYVQTAAGTKRYFPNSAMPRWQYDTQGRNAPVQGTAADIAYRLSERMETQLVPQGILPVNFVHDEVVALAPEARAEEAKALLVAEMQAAFDDILPYTRYGLRIKVDAHVARHWTKE